MIQADFSNGKDEMKKIKAELKDIPVGILGKNGKILKLKNFNNFVILHYWMNIVKIEIISINL